MPSVHASTGSSSVPGSSPSTGQTGIEEDAPDGRSSLGAVPGQVLVRFRNGTGAARQEAVLTLAIPKTRMVRRFGG
ncbi:MAG: hypothetical protein M1608_16695, partial [Candidatus Omnitrophica bacterium]|nr:hypothetical protein [Candidatus Omnitrophota bacterium]